MQTSTLVFWGMLAAAGIAVLIHYIRAEKPLQTAVKGMLSGAAALAAVHFWGHYIGLSIEINLFNTVISLIFGAPGVIAVSLIDKFLI